ncbi:hypothetical protein PL373_13525 [Tenacibaculum maritimum]|nr:hypothetical protein [Tenacibaculum maritimum]MDB0602150.1 hypothetical protein [Tenacibaculum maritimum]MDB0613825.1 hypothetical protein [Tenacibaculum maritimum]
MVLGFSTKFPKAKGKLSGLFTRFPEKIMRSLDVAEYKKMTLFDGLAETLQENDIMPITDFLKLKPKKHTMRSDKKDRWKVGMNIDFFVGVRTKNMFRFAPKLEVKSIQTVKIIYDEEICEAFGSEPCVFIDEKPLHIDDYETLAINDGFDSIYDFFEWFDRDFEGKIIHWTDLKY